MLWHYSKTLGVKGNELFRIKKSNKANLLKFSNEDGCDHLPDANWIIMNVR